MRKIFIIAHGGFSLISPENTISSFKKAIETGGRLLETDLRATNNGIIVCMHYQPLTEQRAEQASSQRTATGK